MSLLGFYRSLPWFQGKLRLGKMLFGFRINQSKPTSFKGHDDIYYEIPNTEENLGIELLINGVYEQDIVQFLKEQISDNTTYFDIGANIGALGLPIVKAKKNIRYYGFEASPMVFKYLEANFLSNHIHHFKLYNKLVHKNDDQVLKFYQSELYGKSSLAPTYSRDFVLVESVCLDGFCERNNINKIDWMKVDVQGFEIYVFQGMQELLKKKKIKNILFEYEPWAEEQAQLRIGIAKDFIESMGYTLYSLNGQLWTGQTRGADTMIWAKLK